VSGGPETSGDAWVEAELTVSAAAAGTHSIRIITADGLSNAVSFEVLQERVQQEPDNPEMSGAAVIAGTLGAPGELDMYWITVSAGETWTFEATAGTRALDPALAILEPSGSWFNSRRLNRIAINDEPLHFPGLSSNAKLVHTFAKAGKYAVSVSGFAGQGGPDCTYILKAVRGTTPDSPLHPEATGWQERLFTRPLTSVWLERVAARGTKRDPTLQQPETWEAVDAASVGVPVITAPGVVHGRIVRPAETQAVTLRVDKPEDLVLEIETPLATMPLFNPVVRLLDTNRNELVTNVYTKRNNNGLYMMKMIQPKATVALRSPGLYRLEIRDITTDRAGEDFEYKVLVRRSIPHLGKVSVSEAQANVRAGGMAELHITIDREENFTGTIAFEADGLPPGVSIVPGAANPVERPPLPNGGKVERYTPGIQHSILLLKADANAHPTESPVMLRLFARPVAGGVPGTRIPAGELPLFIAADGTS
jgi:hypothetical protein